MTRSYVDYLRDIINAIDDAQSFVDQIDLVGFLASKEKQYAVIRALEVIGEAAAQIPLELRKDYPEPPWREMVGMRNIVIHNYYGVDEAVVWRTIEEELPPLKIAIEHMLADLLGKL